MAGIYQMMWFVMLESSKDRVIGVDSLGQQVPPCVWYGTSCLLITVLSLLLPCIIILFLHLLSTDHKCTQPCYFPLLLKLVVQKEKMDWNSSIMSSRFMCCPDCYTC
jgi:hypothetical protein